jgi:hypothetical protein
MRQHRAKDPGASVHAVRQYVWSRFAVIKTVGDYAQRQGLSLGIRVSFSRSISQYTGERG